MALSTAAYDVVMKAAWYDYQLGLMRDNGTRLAEERAVLFGRWWMAMVLLS